MESYRTYLLNITIPAIFFIAFPVWSTPASPEFHQIIDGDSDSYEAFNRSFFSYQHPILKLATHSSLCKLDLQNSDHMAIRNTAFIQKKEQSHLYIGAYFLCSEIASISELKPVPTDVTQLYMFEGLSALRSGSISFIREAASLMITKDKLTKEDAVSLARYLGITDKISVVHDSRLTGSIYPFVTFSTVDAENSKEISTSKHRLISVYSSDFGVFIYEREKISRKLEPWHPLDIKRHIKAISLLQSGVGDSSLDSYVLKNQPEAEGAYFLENVAFALRLEFENNNFGYPLLLRLDKDPDNFGHLALVIDANTINIENDWLYYTEAWFASTTIQDDPSLNLATNLPKIIIKKKAKVSCKRKLRTDLFTSLNRIGAKDNWEAANPEFREVGDHESALTKILCDDQIPSQNATSILRSLDSLFRYDFYNFPNYSISALRLSYEHTLFIGDQ